MLDWHVPPGFYDVLTVITYIVFFYFNGNLMS